MSEYEEELHRAIILACRAHYGQHDKAGQPYILHPLTVMLSCDNNLDRIVAVLHDVAEDSAMSVAEVLDYIHVDMPGDVIADIGLALESLTHNRDDDYETYIRIVAANTMATRIKRADIAHNMVRLKGLPLDEQIRLTNKYQKALQILGTKQVQSNLRGTLPILA